MRLPEKYVLLVIGLGMLAMALSINSCESKYSDQPIPDNTGLSPEFPAFITPTEEYFETRIGEIPAIEGDTFQLEISGAVDNPAVITLEKLMNLKMIERTLTIECIGNPANGPLLGTATWKGFRVYDLLDSLGINDKVTTVKYHCSDGYFTYNSLEELQNSDVIAALYMNGFPQLKLRLMPVKPGSRRM